ncbi:MAG: SCO family protein [Acidimicrobiales bacterium]
MLRRLVTLVSGIVVVLAACGGAEDTALRGATLEPAPVVSTLQAPEGGDGTPFRFVADQGGLLAVYFGYTQCPDLCPTTMADLKSALRRLGTKASRVDVAMVTVDPARDTAAVLRTYLSHFFPAEQVHALRFEDPTAQKAVETGFLATSKVTTTAGGAVEVSHTAMTSIVDDQGRIVVQWPFGTSAETMAHDLNVLLGRAR